HSPTVSFYNFGSGEYPGDSMRVELFAYDSATFVRGYPTENVTFTLSVVESIETTLVSPTESVNVTFATFVRGYPTENVTFTLSVVESIETTLVSPTESVNVTFSTFVRGYPTENVTFTLSVGDTSVVSIDSTTLTIPAGAETSAVAWAHLKGLGTATVTVTDPRAAPYAYAPATTPPVTVIQPYLATQESTVSLGIRLSWELFVVVNGPYGGGLVVHLRQSNPAVLSLSDTAITIGAYPNNGSVVTTGTAGGVDTVVVSAAGFRPDTTIITVGTPTIAIPQWPPTLAVGDTFPL